MIANLVTGSRIVFSLCLLGLSPYSAGFAVLYVLCGVSDVLDGFLARRLHTASKAGERLDSIADLFFAAVYAGKLLPILELPAWIWVWTALIAAVKLLGIRKRGKQGQGWVIEHSAANKLTGLLLFLLPMTVRFLDGRLGAAAVCIAATVAAAGEWSGKETGV